MLSVGKKLKVSVASIGLFPFDGTAYAGGLLGGAYACCGDLPHGQK